jgi:hypothetical protein
MARDPMMQQSPAMPDMAGANMRGGNPMPDLPQKGKANLAKPQAEIAAVLVARLGPYFSTRARNAGHGNYARSSRCTPKASSRACRAN